MQPLKVLAVSFLLLGLSCIGLVELRCVCVFVFVLLLIFDHDAAQDLLQRAFLLV